MEATTKLKFLYAGIVTGYFLKLFGCSLVSLGHAGTSSSASAGALGIFDTVLEFVYAFYGSLRLLGSLVALLVVDLFWDACRRSLVQGATTYHLGHLSARQNDIQCSGLCCLRKRQGRDMQKVKCFSCKEYGHIATNCTRNSCNYSLGLQGNGSLSPSWIIDSGASNHMTSSSDTLSNVRTYTELAHIQIANDCQLPIHAIGDVDSTIRDVFVSPQLSTRSSVGQDTCEGA
ncbi:hypothetical protein Patl1_14057 [Pistacia atlantica]|uniref:Uncharacterized protein n=1 Tax=Pistacia atlantica TaxID=434234 RepID=A0ACC1AXC3_9ROSI|nr:hypothetical protein Patl1_14057 [Pistacia atlantica]